MRIYSMPLDVTKLVGVKQLSGRITAMCPVCCESSHSHLVIFDTGKFGCVTNQSPEHRSAIWALVGMGSDGTVVEQPLPRVRIEESWDVSILDRLIKDHSYWESRGVSAATVAPFRGGVAVSGNLRDRYVLPIFNEDETKVIGVTGRRLKETMRAKWLHKGAVRNWVWGGLDEIDERAIIVESPGDLLMLREHGVADVVCSFGTSLSQTLMGWLISRNPRQIVISTNRDDWKEVGGVMRQPGQEAALRAKAALEQFFDEGVVSILHPVAKDWGCSSAAEIAAAFQTPIEPAGEIALDMESTDGIVDV